MIVIQKNKSREYCQSENRQWNSLNHPQWWKIEHFICNISEKTDIHLFSFCLKLWLVFSHYTKMKALCNGNKSTYVSPQKKMLYTENLGNSQHMIITTKCFNTCTSYKFNMQRSILFLFTNNHQANITIKTPSTITKLLKHKINKRRLRIIH